MRNLNKTYKYKVIKGKKDNINTRINKLKILNYDKIDKLSFDNVSNSSNLWCLIKEELTYNIDYCGNRLKLINMNEHQLKIKINEIYNKRKNVII